MVATKRALDDFINETTGLWKDNTAGDISASDGRDMIASMYGGGLYPSDESTSFNAVVGTHHRVTVTTSLITVTMPSSGLLDGDRIRITCALQTASVGSFAVAPGFSIGFASGTNINGASYTGVGTGKWSEWLTGETLLLEWDATLSTWWVVHDGRIAQWVSPDKSANQTGETASTWTRINVNQTRSGLDPAGLLDTSNFNVKIKRANFYSANAQYKPLVAPSDGSLVGTRVRNTTANQNIFYKVGPVGASTTTMTVNGAGGRLCSSGDVVEWQFYTSDGSRGYDIVYDGNGFHLREQLQMA